MLQRRVLLKENKKVSLREIPLVSALGPDEVEVSIKLGGICRTDLYVAQGRIPSPDPMIIGHECAGVVTNLGRSVRHLSEGDRVVIAPWLGCGDCALCDEHRSDLCPSSRMLGLHIDGAFCDSIILPSRALYSTGDLSWSQAAFVEPVAACLGVLNAPLYSQSRGVIIGDGRIARLTQKILAAHGLIEVQTVSLEEASALADRSFDFAIETAATEESIQQMIRVLRPKGRLIIKSRPPVATPVDLWALTRKELQLHAVHYGSFKAAILLLQSGTLMIDDLFGERWPIVRFQDAINAALQHESKKQFLVFDEQLQ